jgi:hypothetical protein
MLPWFPIGAAIADEAQKLKGQRCRGGAFGDFGACFSGLAGVRIAIMAAADAWPLWCIIFPSFPVSRVPDGLATGKNPLNRRPHKIDAQRVPPAGCPRCTRPDPANTEPAAAQRGGRGAGAPGPPRPGGPPARSSGFGLPGKRPSRCARLRASLRARRMASAFSRAFFSEVFS